MPWWGWVLFAWFVVAVAASLFFGAMAATVKEFERGARTPSLDGVERSTHDVA
jgi:hypothetical protein